MMNAPYPVDMLFQNAAETPDKIWLRQPDDQGETCWTWSEAADEVGRLAASLKSLGFAPGARIAISGRNTAHWFMSDLAIALAGYVSVGLYPKQAEDSTRYILDHCDAQAVFVGPAQDVEVLFGAIPKGVVTIAMPYDDLPKCDYRWTDLANDEAPLTEYQRPEPSALMSLVYTSGTTGHPKGVIVSYANIQFAYQAFLQWFPSKGDERLLSYLPLSHLLERVAVEMSSLAWGAEVTFLEHIDNLSKRLQAVAPTRYFGVPLVYGRIQGGVLEKIPLKRLQLMMKVPLLRTFIRRKILRTIGLQNARSCLSGAASVPVSTVRFFKDLLGIELLEGYGMSENIAYLSAGLPGQVRVGSVGRPFPDAGFRLAEDGEIQCKHPGNTAGYYRQPDETAELFTSDGYLRTGDKGRLDDDGYLYITGRVKDIFKTAKGKYVAPAPIEGALARNTAIDQLCLVGSQLTQPVMLITLTDTARKHDSKGLEPQLLADMQAVNATLEPHERIAKLLVIQDVWLPDNGFMTPTMKVKRNVVEERYQSIIEDAGQDRTTMIAWV